MAYGIAVAIVSGVVLLDGLVVLEVRLLVMLALLVVEWQGHALAAQGTTIKPGRVALLMVLREHASYVGSLVA